MGVPIRAAITHQGVVADQAPWACAHHVFWGLCRPGESNHIANPHELRSDFQLVTLRDWEREWEGKNGVSSSPPPHLTIASATFSPSSESNRSGFWVQGYQQRCTKMTKLTKGAMMIIWWPKGWPCPTQKVIMEDPHWLTLQPNPFSPSQLEAKWQALPVWVGHTGGRPPATYQAPLNSLHVFPCPFTWQMPGYPRLGKWVQQHRQGTQHCWLASSPQNYTSSLQLMFPTQLV